MFRSDRSFWGGRFAVDFSIVLMDNNGIFGDGKITSIRKALHMLLKEIALFGICRGTVECTCM